MIKFIKWLIVRIRIPKGLYCNNACPYYWFIPESASHWHWCNYQCKGLDEEMPYRSCGINVSPKNEGGTR
jgi:hypothetical protein